MTDEELLVAFQNGTLPYEQWTHRAHVRVAYLYVHRCDLVSATNRIRTSINAYNKATDTPEAIDRGYHETITRAFMHLVFVANLQTGPYANSDDFCDAHPELLTKFVLREHYSRERLMTWDAKRDFVEPDLRPLPTLGDELRLG